MRLPGIALCTLASVAVGSLAAHATEVPIVQGEISQLAADSIDTSSPVLVPTETTSSTSTESQSLDHQPAVNPVAVAAPETIATGEIIRPIMSQSTVVAGLPNSESDRIASPVILSAPETIKTTNIQSNSDASQLTGTAEVNSTTPAAAMAAPSNPVQLELAGTPTLLADVVGVGNKQLDRATAGSAATPHNCVAQAFTPDGTQIAQANRCPRPEPIQPLVVPEPYGLEASPALSIYIPVGYGADKMTAFISGSYQSDVREDDFDAGTFGVGIGLGDADKYAGLELSYAFASDMDFGKGGFNAKLHKRFPGDLAVAVGWNGFLNIGRNDFEQSIYGVATKIFRLKDSIDEPFSRIAVTAGVGDNQFRSVGAIRAGENNVNVFGNVAVRIIRPVSFIAEWTGTDLALGVSIAPFKNIPFVITPAVRDLVSVDNYDPRFVLGAGFAYQF
ncbi:MAG TPA: hypothetical protein V6C64_07555 [Microcoleaceae cyanobacterium]|jgi:hypothetical protein